MSSAITVVDVIVHDNPAGFCDGFKLEVKYESAAFLEDGLIFDFFISYFLYFHKNSNFPCIFCHICLLLIYKLIINLRSQLTTLNYVLFSEICFLKIIFIFCF